MIQTGRGLSRYFEAETPGLAHRQALSGLLGAVSWSPPRQALVWAALDVTIASALQAAWYYKWLSPRTSFRQRPIEYDPSLDILFDNPDELNPTRPPCPSPGNKPGKPCHPAYPSGHSACSGAASELLSFFFSSHRKEFDRLADNAGMARLWAGIHWRSDHIEGMKLGRAVARLVIQQLADSGIELCPPPPPAQCNDNQMPPARADVEKAASDFKKGCGLGKPLPYPKSKPFPKPCKEKSQLGEIDLHRHVQQGAR